MTQAAKSKPKYAKPHLIIPAEDMEWAAEQIPNLTDKHHRNELNHLEDLITLCNDCHRSCHKKEGK